MSDLRLLLVALDPLARAGLATLLVDRSGFQVVGQSGGGEGLPAEIDLYRPDVLIWDLGWDPTESLVLLGDFMADLENDLPEIVALLPDEEQAVETWSSGARGLLLRDVTGERLSAAVTAVANGLAVVEPSLSDSLQPARGSSSFGGLSSFRGAAPLGEALALEEVTPRELEVLQLLAEGLANKAIARRLDISEHTVKFHVNAIMSKLGAQSRTAAVVQATRLGLILL
jgi:DNA-binding NarL/FixJ family response regulator